MNNEFLVRFIEKKCYLQNRPLDTNEFIDYCKKVGINTNEKELEFFEKEGLFYPLIRIKRPIGEEEWISFLNDDGKTYSRPAADGLRTGEKEVGRYKQCFYSEYDFISRYTELFLSWIKEGLMFDPSTKDFESWSSFLGEELINGNQKKVSLFVSYQIYWLNIIKNKYCIKISLVGDSKKELDDENQMYRSSLFQSLKNDYKNFLLIMKFLISIQRVYAPYGRSDAKGMQVIANSFESLEWEDIKINFKPKKELDELGLDIRFIVQWYQLFSRQSSKLLGGEKHNWMQLLKNINWSVKDDLEDQTRLGIEYMQWSLMIKAFIEQYLGKSFLDIDEIIDCRADSFIGYDVTKIRERWNLRGVRNSDYSENGKNYWDNKYKRLFYLANQFRIDYQPRVIVLVEGQTEEEILPKIFEWYYDKPENLGIDILCFEGVDRLLSTSKTAEDLRNCINGIQKDIKSKAISSSLRSDLNKIINRLNDIDIVISNWTSFISYNLEKWQILPFFLSDNEGNIKHFLEAETPIKYHNMSFNVPRNWRYLWGIDNSEKPFVGGCFEFANFSDMEIKSAIEHIIGHTIDLKEITELRKKGYSINKLDKDIKYNKIKIGNKLIYDLFNLYQHSKNKEILERPIFKVIEKIINIAALNHPPSNRLIEINNKEIIENLLKD